MKPYVTEVKDPAQLKRCVEEARNLTQLNTELLRLFGPGRVSDVLQRAAAQLFLVGGL